jgi:nitrate/nitrite transporter NarK
MGIWAALVPVGNVIAFNTAHPILASLGWRAVWWFGAALALGALVVFGLVVTAPPGAHHSGSVPASAFGRMLRNRTTWLLALTFGAFAFSLIAYNTWAPAFLTETLQIDGARASFYASLMFLAAIPANVIAGWLLNRIGKRYLLLPTSFLITCILFFWSFRLGSESIVAPYMLLLGFASNFVPASTFTFAPETMPGIGFAGLALAIVSMGSSTGSLTGPPVLGAVLSTGNWTLASTCLVIVTGVGTLASWLATRRLARDAGK